MTPVRRKRRRMRRWSRKKGIPKMETRSIRKFGPNKEAIVTISIPKSKLPMLEQINDMATSSGLSRSSIIVGVLENAMALAKFSNLESAIVDRYKNGEFGEVPFEITFDDVLGYELKTNSFRSLMLKWQITREQLVTLLSRSVYRASTGDKI